MSVIGSSGQSEASIMLVIENSGQSEASIACEW